MVIIVVVVVVDVVVVVVDVVVVDVVVVVEVVDDVEVEVVVLRGGGSVQLPLTHSSYKSSTTLGPFPLWRYLQASQKIYQVISHKIPTFN